MLKVFILNIVIMLCIQQSTQQIQSFTKPQLYNVFV